jgi:hypothetical protein
MKEENYNSRKRNKRNISIRQAAAMKEES